MIPHRVCCFVAGLLIGCCLPAFAQPAGETETDYRPYGIYARTAPRANPAEPQTTTQPLELNPGDRIALIGNNLLDRSQHFGYLESLIQQAHPDHQLIVRNLAWSGDTPDLQPRPDNFADWDQHLTHERADVVLVAFGFNESFAGETGREPFRKSLTEFVTQVKSKAFNGKTAPRVVLLSPIANETVEGFDRADENNRRLEAYTEIVERVAKSLNVGYVDLFDVTKSAMADPTIDLTINGSDLNDRGYRLFAETVFRGLFDLEVPTIDEALRETVLDKNRQYFRRYRPLNTFYYTGGRSKKYGYLDFLPAMRNFDITVANRDRRIWNIARGNPVPERVDDSNLPPLPETEQSRGANRWMSAKDELAEFKIDPRFEVTLFAGEEEFPEIAAPIQMRWDNRGRLWVSCSTTYPHVYPGNEPDDKLVVLEDTDGDGKADRSTVFADDLHIPLSFEFGDGGVYVSEPPHLTFLKDTDGDGKADFRKILLSGFGTEDSHHSLHDFVWTPDGDLMFRESIFHHSQVETPYGPVRQQNSGWFRYRPNRHHLLSFGSYPSTNPWGVTFDDWGQHQASHPIFASAFHALDPPYPTQHPRPNGLRAYSGTCGQEFVDFDSFPEEMRGNFIKARYKPTNRIEIHKWKEYEFGYDEEYVGDLIFSSNLSFIPVDIRFGPRGALYICDWYNPVKGHAQYSLRDERRDRHSGRIWRVTAKDRPLVDPPQISGASIEELLEIHKRPEYRYRYWAKRELRERNSEQVKTALDRWVATLDPEDPRFRHHQVEAIWLYRNIGRKNIALLREVLACENHHARAAATRQLRYWHSDLDDSISLLNQAANDPSGLVRLEAANAASYVGTKDALDAILDIYRQPIGGHLAYAVNASVNSHTLRPHWENDPGSEIPKLIKLASRSSTLKEPKPTRREARFDRQPNLKTVRIGCLPERMQFTTREITARPGQPIKIVFANQDATDHNLVLVKPGSLAEVGMAANEMARDPKNANSDFIPEAKRDRILHHSPMIGPTRKSRIHVLRFNAPSEPGVYPFVCTFPGHWVIMNGAFAVGTSEEDARARIAALSPKIVRNWKLSDFDELTSKHDEQTMMRGFQAFVKARCNQCHKVAGHGVDLGPNLADIGKRFRGKALLKQLIEPSAEINKKYRVTQFLTKRGQVVAGVILEETDSEYRIAKNLLAPGVLTTLKKVEIDEQFPGRLSPMPTGMLDVLTREEITDLVNFLEHGTDQTPGHLHHGHGEKPSDP